MKNLISTICFVFACIVLVGCQSMNQHQIIEQHKVTEWSADPGEVYQVVDRSKLMIPAFSQDYKDKLVTFNASYYGIGGSTVLNYNKNEFMQITLAAYDYGRGKIVGGAISFYNILPKSQFDTLRNLSVYQNLKISGRAILLADGELAILIHKIEVLPN